MTPPTLHLVIDPLCGWCYGATSLFETLLDIDGLNVNVHCPGMFVGPRVKKISPQWKDFATSNDVRIEAISGQKFGTAYKNNLLNDNTATLDSEPPAIAILAAASLGLNPVTMLCAVQKAMFLDGQRISDVPVLTDIAVKNGLDEESFTTAYQTYANGEFARHAEKGRHFLVRINGNGFPSAALEHPLGTYTPLDISSYYGHPAQWRALVEKQIQA